MKKVISVVILLLCTVGPVLGTLWYESVRNEDVTAEILTRAPERGNFLPRKLTVRAGEKVRLRVRNVDTVTHGFTLPDLAVDAGDIKAGHQVVLEFTPEKPGKYAFYCTAWCSEFHLQMRGVLEVVAE